MAHRVYPISLNITGRTCLIIGGGAVAVRKAHGLLAEGALVTVLSPTLHPDLEAMAISHIQAVYQEHYLQELKPLLVFAATDNTQVNRQIVQDAHDMSILVNAVDNSADDDFSNLLTLEKPPLTIAISTGGASPVLGQHLRDEIDNLMGDHYPTLAQWLADLRDSVIQNISAASQRRDFWRSVLDSDILSLLKQGQVQSARIRLDALYAEAVGESA